MALEPLDLPGRLVTRVRHPEGVQDHPTVKPVALLADALLDLTGREEIVLDPFLGSGSTLIAAERTGRRCYGVEIDPRYVDLIVRRYEEVTGCPAIHDAAGVPLGQAHQNDPIR